ncbi:MAG: carboxymuconolactone decarboxylase family protein [Planctomycetota bacterium]|jgi:hypothetical protein
MKAWIDSVDPDNAVGLVKELYEKMGPAHIVRAHSAMSDGMNAMYEAFKGVWKKSKLSIVEREMIATAVSALNECYY